jgi:hypothetical protein
MKAHSHCGMFLAKCGTGKVWYWHSAVLAQCGTGTVRYWHSAVLAKCGTGTVVDHSTHNPKIMGSDPVFCTERDKKTNIFLLKRMVRGQTPPHNSYRISQKSLDIGDQIRIMFYSHKIQLQQNKCHHAVHSCNLQL